MLKIKTEQVGFRSQDNLTFCNRDKRAYFIAVTGSGWYVAH